jgi:hypothetical protein
LYIALPDVAIKSPQLVDGISTLWHKHNHSTTHRRQKSIAGL